MDKTEKFSRRVEPQLKSELVLTIDHDDFETYRFGRNRKFRIAPGR